MTSGQLIEKLKELDPEGKRMVQYQYKRTLTEFGYNYHYDEVTDIEVFGNSVDLS